MPAVLLATLVRTSAPEPLETMRREPVVPVSTIWRVTVSPGPT